MPITDPFPKKYNIVILKTVLFIDDPKPSKKKIKKYIELKVF